MTERLYYTDAYLSSFSARVVDRQDDGRRIYLDRSAFYPTSGGQPHDVGTLDGVAVVDVIDEGDRVAHVLSATLAAGVETVDGAVQWPRRFDFMQQHTGQHLLSALFQDRYGWPTVSVHFGSDSSTLDVAASDWDTGIVAEAERVANQLLAENREVVVRFEDAAVATGLRKPTDREGTIRLVAIEGVDTSACGGTHVRRTGEIGSVLLRRTERTKGHTRIEFLCGLRAVAAARHDAALLARSAALFTAAVADVPRLIETQQQQLHDLEREHRRLKLELAAYEARAHWQVATPDADGVRRVHITAGGAVKEQEALAQAIAALGGALVVVTSVAPAGVLVAASVDSGIDAGQAIRAAVGAVGGRGGGSPRLGQASVPDASALAAVCLVLGVTVS